MIMFTYPIVGLLIKLFELEIILPDEENGGLECIGCDIPFKELVCRINPSRIWWGGEGKLSHVTQKLVKVA